jgi:hypothetical protein
MGYRDLPATLDEISDRLEELVALRLRRKLTPAEEREYSRLSAEAVRLRHLEVDLRDPQPVVDPVSISARAR